MTSFELWVKIDSRENSHIVSFRVTGVVTFKKKTTQHRDIYADPTIKYLKKRLQETCHVSSPTFKGTNVVEVRFAGSQHLFEYSYQAYKEVFAYCETELSVLNVRAREDLCSVKDQITTLERTLKKIGDSEKAQINPELLVTSIRYGIMDLFGGLILDPPKTWGIGAIRKWLAPIKTKTKELEKTRKETP